MRYVVETKENGNWRVYRDGRKFKQSSDAYRFMDKLQERWPSAEFRVATVG